MKQAVTKTKAQFSEDEPETKDWENCLQIARGIIITLNVKDHCFTITEPQFTIFQNLMKKI